MTAFYSCRVIRNISGMRRTYYLIQFRFHGYAKKYLKDLIYEIGRKFRVRGVTRRRAVPHVTLFGGFTTEDRKKMVSEVVSVLKNYDLVPFKLGSFISMESPKDHHKVIAVGIESSEELKNLRWDIAQRLLPITEAEPETRGFDSASANDFKFHATIAFKDIDKKFDAIRNYIKRKEEPNIDQHLLRVTILRNSKILFEYDLMQRKPLNRKQALDKKIWKSTIEIYLEKSGISASKESLGGKIKNWFTRLFTKNDIFLISDLHLDHTNIIKYCNRPFKSTWEMNKTILKNWNGTVKRTDTVYFLGDMAFGRGSSNARYWLGKLKGKIVFIKGYHDDTRNFKSFNSRILNYKGHKFLLIHNPEDAPENWDGWVIHGHKHNNDLDNFPFINSIKRTINVSAELLDYTPISIDELLDYIANKKIPSE
jgi:calcineurin-like phosphoesterase family protein/2'-5' RNA ligase